jgi:murein hydrolase activator
MKKVLIVMLGLLTGMFNLAYAATDKPNETHVISTLSEEIDSLKKHLIADKNQQARLTTELEQTELAIAKSAMTLQHVESKVANHKIRLADLAQQKKDFDQQIAQEQESLALHLRSIYLMGKESYSKMLLNQDTFSGMEKMLTYFSYMHQGRNRSITNLQQMLGKLNVNERETRQQSMELSRLLSKLSEEHRQLLQEQRIRAKLLANRDALIKTKTTRLNTLAENKKNLENIIQRLQKANKEPAAKFGSDSFAALKRKLPWPTQGNIINHFGSPVEHSDLTWNGILISATEGQQVHSVYTGTVIFANWLKGFGLLLIIEHEDGYMTLYSRNRSLYKQAGEQVEAGELIASVGQSGGYDETGLYFELRHNGHPENPEEWFCRSG